MSTENHNRFVRQESFLPYDKVSKQAALVIGCGAIGRQVGLLLASLGVGRVALVDFDKVDEVNTSTQGWHKDDLNTMKCETLADFMEAINEEIDIKTYKEKFDAGQLDPGIKTVFACVDNMEVRKQIWESLDDGVLFIDGRMSLHVGVVIACVKGTDDYMRHWFPDSEARQDPCTARGTLYGASHTASQMVAIAAQHIAGVGSSVKNQFDFFNWSFSSKPVGYVETEGSIQG